MAMRSNRSSQRYSAWRSCRMLPSPASLMPSCLRTALVPPSQPTRYCAVMRRAPAALATSAVTRVRVLRERKELAAVAHRHARQRLGHRFEQRLERVLRDELIGLERQRAVMVRRDLFLGLRDRRIGQVQQRRLDQRHDDVHVHRHARRQPGGADFVRQPQPPVDFHGARVAALHLRPHVRRAFLLDQRAAHAAAAEIDGERQPDRAGADDENIRLRGAWHSGPGSGLDRDDVSSNRHRDLAFCLSMIFSENRCALFGIML